MSERVSLFARIVLSNEDRVHRNGGPRTRNGDCGGWDEGCPLTVFYSIF